MIEKDSKVWKLVTYTVLIFLTVLSALPFIWMLSASLKLESEVFSVPIQWIPNTLHWDNYLKIWEKVPFALFTFNSVKITAIVTSIQLITSSFAAYGFSKCKFRGRDTLFMCYIITIAIPWQVYMLPQYILMQKLGLVNTHLAIILLQSFTAFGVFLLRQFYQGVPDELLEAARIDGLSEYGIYMRIMVPLSKPAIATLTIFSFVNTWNDFMGPMIYFNSTNLKTIQLGIRMFISQYSASYHLIMAASLFALIPVLVLYVSFQRFFVQGIATSGLKG